MAMSGMLEITKIMRIRWCKATKATSKPNITASKVTSYNPPGTNASQMDRKSVPVRLDMDIADNIYAESMSVVVAMASLK